MRHTYLVAYDIADDVRLRRVHKTLCGYGSRLQYSVFECKLSAADLAQCRHAVGKLIHHKEDQVLFVNLGPADGRGERVISAVGRPCSRLDAPCLVIDGDDEDQPLTGPRRHVEAIERARDERRDRREDPE